MTPCDCTPRTAALPSVYLFGEHARSSGRCAPSHMRAGACTPEPWILAGKRLKDTPTVRRAGEIEPRAKEDVCSLLVEFRTYLAAPLLDGIDVPRRGHRETRGPRRGRPWQLRVNITLRSIIHVKRWDSQPMVAWNGARICADGLLQIGACDANTVIVN